MEHSTTHILYEVRIIPMTSALWLVSVRLPFYRMIFTALVPGGDNEDTTSVPLIRCNYRCPLALNHLQTEKGTICDNTTSHKVETIGSMAMH